jgi:hypothetical protein
MGCAEVSIGPTVQALGAAAGLTVKGVALKPIVIGSAYKQQLDGLALVPRVVESVQNRALQ